MIPKVIKNFNLFVDGRGLFGKIDELTLPTLTQVIEEHRAGGQDMPVPISMGMEMMTLSFTSAEHDKELIKLFGLQDQNAVQLEFRGSMVDDTSTTSYVIAANGMINELNFGSVSNGQKSPLEISMNLRYFKVTQDGEELIEVDADNMIRKIGGVDQLEAERAAIGY